MPSRIQITTDTLLRIALVAVGLWLVVQLVPVFLIIIVGLMIMGMLNPMIKWLERRQIPRGFGIAIVFGGVALVSLLIIAITIPRLLSQLSDILVQLPKAQAALTAYLESHRWSAPLAQAVRSMRVTEVLSNGARTALTYSPQILEIVGGAVTAAFFALYLLIDRDRMRGGLFALVPRTYHVRLSRVLLGLETIVGGYMRGQMITSLLMAAFTFVVLRVAHVPNALPLAVFAGAADVLPYIGGALAAGPAVLSALVHGPTVALVVLAVLLLYQEFENRFLVPRIYGNALRLPSAVVIIALVVGGKLLGILGALLALPVASGVRMIVEELRVELPGDVADDPSLKKRDRRGEAEYQARADGVGAVEAAAIATEIAATQVELDAAALLKADSAAAGKTQLTD